MIWFMKVFVYLYAAKHEYTASLIILYFMSTENERI